VANLSDERKSGRYGFFVGEMDRWGWRRGLLRSSLERKGRRVCAQLAGILPLRRGHVTSLPSVPRAGAHLEAGSAGGSGECDDSYQEEENNGRHDAPGVEQDSRHVFVEEVQSSP
jgi:hypothetical protein